MKIKYEIVLLSFCILLSGYWIGDAIKQDEVKGNNVDINLSLSALNSHSTVHISL